MSDEKESEEGKVEQVLSIRIAVEDLVAMGFEVRLLREQVSFLQAMGTTQLSASRAACFEAAALECDRIRSRVELSLGGYPPVETGESEVAADCAAAIRALAKR
jgi:hypothetical protein